MNHEVPAYLPLLVAAPWIWFAAWVGASAVWRHSRGLPILTPRPADAIFFEGICSGNSLKSFFTRITHVNNGLQVAVTPDLLVIRLFFPLNLMFFGGWADLEHYAPRATARAQITSTSFFRTWVVAEFDIGDGERRAFRLAMKDPEGFIAALAS
jgi:hypothetical protein